MNEEFSEKLWSSIKTEFGFPGFERKSECWMCGSKGSMLGTWMPEKPITCLHCGYRAICLVEE